MTGFDKAAREKAQDKTAKHEKIAEAIAERIFNRDWPSETWPPTTPVRVKIYREKAADVVADLLALGIIDALDAADSDNARLRARVSELEAAQEWRPLLRNFMCYLHSLNCIGCRAQGRELAAKCCRDLDCDAGFYGVDADAIKQLLEAGESLMPGTLAGIENPADPISEAALPAPPIGNR